MFPSINLRQKINTITLANRLLKHQKQMLNFLYDTPYDIIYLNFQHKHPSYLDNKQIKDLRPMKLEQMAKFYQQISQKLHTRILRDDIDLDRALYRLQLLWDHKQIPLFHRYYFEKYIYTAYLKNITSLVLNEQKLIREQTHIYFNIIRALFARQSCIKSLKFTVSQLNPNDVFQYLHLSKQQNYYQQKKLQKQKYEIQGYKVKKDSGQLNQPTIWKTKLEVFGDNFTHLKKLTFYMIDLIVKWKQYIYSLTHDARKHRQKISYYYMDENYLLKILKDLEFLKNTALVNFYQFTEKNDPFLLSCILNIQMKQQKTTDDQLLKKIIFPDQQQYYEIIRKLEILAKQFEANIQRRRLYNFSKSSNTIHKNKEILLNFKTTSLSKVKREKSIQNQSRIKKIDSQNYLTTNSKLFQIKQSPIKAHKIIQLRDSGIKLSNSRLLDGKLRLSTSRLQNSNKNQNYNQFKKGEILNQGIKKYIPRKTLISQSSRIESNKIEQESLVKLREDVVKKIKQQISSESPRKQQIKDPLKTIIQKQIIQVEKQMLSPYQPDIESNPKKSLHLITKSFKQQSIRIQLKRIFQTYPEEYLKMQIPYQQLELLLSKNFCCIIIEGLLGTQQIGYVFCGPDIINTATKTIKIYHIMTNNIEYLDQLMMKTVEFLWKYENSFQIQFKFLMYTNIDSIKSYLEEQKKKLESLCLVVSKQIYNNLKEIKYIFKRKLKNPRYVPNQYPLNLFISLRMILSTQSLQNSNSFKQLTLQTSSYEFMLAELMKRYSTTDDLITLRERCSWKGKLKKILELILRQEKGQIKMPEIMSIQTENITQVNIKLKQNRDKLLELTDSKKNNKIYYVSTKLLFEFEYHLQYTRIHNNPYYKMNINNKLNIIRTSSSPAYLLDTINRTQKVLYINADQYEVTKSNLFLYVLSITEFARIESIQVKNLLIPMIRIPKQYTERDDSYTKTKKLSEFSLLKKELYYNQQIQFFSSLQLQNGIDIDIQSDDIIIEAPYIMAIITNNVPIYAKYIS